MARKAQTYTVCRLGTESRVTGAVTALEQKRMTRDELEAWISGDDFDSGALVFVGDAVPVAPITTAQIGAPRTRKKRTAKPETPATKRKAKNGAAPNTSEVAQ